MKLIKIHNPIAAAAIIKSALLLQLHSKNHFKRVLQRKTACFELFLNENVHKKIKKFCLLFVHLEDTGYNPNCE